MRIEWENLPGIWQLRAAYERYLLRHMKVHLKEITEKEEVEFQEMNEDFYICLDCYLSPPYVPAVLSWEDLQKEEYTGYMICGKNEDYLGFVLCEHRHSDEGPELYIHEMFVSEGCRRMGIGSKAIRQLTRSGVNISMDIIRSNRRAEAFWFHIMPQLGYEECKDNIFVKGSEDDPVCKFCLWRRKK